jgi:hypothetical protein
MRNPKRNAAREADTTQESRTNFFFLATKETDTAGAQAEEWC